MFPEQSIKQRSIAKIAANKLDAIELPQFGQPGFLQRHIVVVVDIVQAHHALTLSCEMLHKVKADKSGGASYQDYGHDLSASRAFGPTSLTVAITRRRPDAPPWAILPSHR